jgi:hypothetical protein
VKDELTMFVRRKRATPRTDTVQVSKEALELLKRTSLAFHHQSEGAKTQSIDKQGTALTAALPTATAAAVMRRYLKGN